ncbi:hypothetical protein SAMN05428953_12631 [Mesorhizobium muleiense]|uniref:Uncharacterized protein n=1 Tax=Mesorhizobium muleiense TaxID=1004279 RepID=A0A1G9H0U3_9HYPH|nr:hypothetical protein [Mesorhizobium muleiense]SDL06491.1 hypothetical protein SAMN05428953_12631 [Mesorhizobium muleiense]
MTKIHKTPWQKVHAKFGMPPSQFARVLNRHRSKISRALRDDKGLISGRDQELLIEVASNYNIPLTSDDLTPEVQ